MTPQELKNSILQLAIQGKLVEQRPEEGTAEELYAQIQAEKQKLIKAGKIKKEKPLPEITEDEIPFEIPESWKWVRLGSCLSGRSGQAYKKENLQITSKDMVRVLRGGNIIDMSYALKDDDVMLDRSFVNEGLLLKKNMLITPAVTSLEHLGKIARIEKDYQDAVAGGFVLMLMPHYSNDVLAFYLMMSISSKYFRNECKEIANKSGQAFYNLSREKLSCLLLPLPPLAEQKRIVAKIEELLPYIDRYAEAWSKLEEFNKRFPEDMQKSILQMAIQGKLVEQRPEEGTAEELYEQIQAEKQKLIKAGKIKKEKPLPELTEDEIPFDIPESWKWSRLLDLCSLIGDIDHNMPKAVDPEHGVIFLSAKDLLDDGTMNFTRDVKYISEEDFTRLSRKALPQRGDIIYSRIGAALGKARVVNTDLRFLVSYSCCTIRPIEVDPYYLRYYLESPLILQHSFDARQSTGVPDLGMGEIKKYIVALPPITEQKRIVAKIEELLPYCKRLK